MRIALRDLILSVGTHRGSRPLSPLEVANGIAELINELGFEAAMEKLTLDPSTARRFLKLRELDSGIAELVDWGRRPGTISFSAAAEIVRVRPDQQKLIAEGCLQHAFTKEETRQVVQLVLRRNDPVTTALSSTLAMRPTVVTIYVVVCAVRPYLVEPLSKLSQRQRDVLLAESVGAAGGGVRAGRLTTTNFSLAADAGVADAEVVRIEEAVNNTLSEALLQQSP